MHRVHDSEVSPRVPSRAGDRYSKSPGAQRAIRNTLEPRPIERDKGGDAIAKAVAREQVPDTAQVAFAFLANSCRKTDGSRRLDAACGHCLRKAQQARYSAGVVAYAGCVEPRAVAPDPHVGLFWKDGIQVSRYNHHTVIFDFPAFIIANIYVDGSRRRPCPGSCCYDVAHVVYSHPAEGQFLEPLGYILTPVAFLEGRRSDLADSDQLVVRESVVLFQEIESSADLRRRKQIGYSRNRFGFSS